MIDPKKSPEMLRHMSDKYREAVSRVENMNQQGGRSQQFDTDTWLEAKGITPTWDYDYDKALRSGAQPTSKGKWPSKYKHDLSPERYVSTTKGWLDTKATDKTGKDVYASWEEVLTQEMKRGEYLDRKDRWVELSTKFGKHMRPQLKKMLEIHRPKK